LHEGEVAQAVADSGGAVVDLPDAEILDAWRVLATEEGLFCEPSSAAGVAALFSDRPPAGSRVVCVLTGHGLKDPDAVDRMAKPPVPVDPDPDAIAEAAA
jgi:threonine synthase